MDPKRIILAVALSLAVLLGWGLLFPTPKQEQSPAPKQQQETAAQHKAGAAAGQPMAQPAEFKPTAGKTITVSTPMYEASFNTNGAVLTNFVLKDFKKTIQPNSPLVDLVGPQAAGKAPLGLILNGKPSWNNAQWSFDGSDATLAGNQTKTLVFTGKVDDLLIERRLTFHAANYLIQEKTRIVNNGPATVDESIQYTTATRSLSAKDNRYNPTRISYYDASGLTEDSSQSDLEEKGLEKQLDSLSWSAIQSNYFIMALIPGSPRTTVKAGIQSDVYRLSVNQQATIGPNRETVLDCGYYIGPCERSQLAKGPKDLRMAVLFGWFDFIAKPLLMAIDWFYKYIPNYGVAIILLTIVIKIIFWPLSHKSYKSMDKMKKLQPMMAKLREKYGDDRQKLNEEVMRLYKTYKVNPAGGCLPMIIQIPVFFGLYKALLGAIELRHAVFIEYLPFTDKLWLADLSAKDPFYITPIVMGATMFLQQRMTPSPGDPTQAKLMLLMPVVFTFIFLNFPSGLVVYWLTNNVLSIAQQWWVLRKA
ncbi:MAG: YidC/Oxa1 family rane protein insertase [Desulfovibrionales bacterium]|jgi:YidC/Oxa1 family membrane protein insertase|nr:YidC/Oxa1 family rane protein insertase [Desulfovibrionales bacterium]